MCRVSDNDVYFTFTYKKWFSWVMFCMLQSIYLVKHTEKWSLLCNVSEFLYLHDFTSNWICDFLNRSLFYYPFNMYVQTGCNNDFLLENDIFWRILSNNATRSVVPFNWLCYGFSVIWFWIMIVHNNEFLCPSMILLISRLIVVGTSNSWCSCNV